MLSIYDYGVIGFYFLFIVAVGWIFRRFSRNSSDYFRGGGQMTWWLVGSSAFMSSFSAWTFTGAASTAYKHGAVILVIYFANAFGFLLNFTTFAAWFRQLRVISAMQAVRARFGAGSEQFFTWLQLPLQILSAAIWLFGLAKFTSATFQLDLGLTIVVTGLAVLTMASIGGSWAVVAGDFVQALILIPITVVAAFFALQAAGGWNNFLAKLPPSHLDLTGSQVTEYGMFWVLAMTVSKIFNINNVQDASRYLCVKDGAAARKAALLSTVLYIIGPLVWFLPPMAARVVHPDLHTVFPGMTNPSEGAYVAIALHTMPAGLLGLLVTGIFATTMASMDTGLNRNAGIFIKSVYQPLLRPRASERELVVAGKLASITFGLLVIGVALVYNSWKDMELFSLMINFSALITIPYSVPLFWCLLVRRVPPWAGWSTVLVGLTVSILVSNGPNWTWVRSALAGVGAGGLADWVKAHDFIAAIAANVTIGSAWFFATRLFYDRSSAEYKERVETFFATMHRPVDFAREIGESSDRVQASALSTLCLVYGGFVGLLVLIPNNLAGRLSIAFCAGCMGLTGWLLRRSARAVVAAKEAPPIAVEAGI